MEGNRDYTPEQVIAASGLHIGEPATEKDFDAARDRLTSTGAFDRVGYRFLPANDKKGYDAILIVSEMEQKYPVRFELPVNETDLRSFLRDKDPLFGPKIPATEATLDRYKQWIAEYLAAHHQEQEITGKVVSEHAPNLEILFRSAEPRPSIANVKFVNTGEIPAQELQRSFYQVAVGTIYTEQNVRTLLDSSIRPLYEAKGRIGVSFPSIQTQPAPDVKGVNVIVNVDEGPVYRFGKIAIQGASAGSEGAKIANLKSGEVANFDVVRATQSELEKSEQRRGYIHVQSDITRNVHEDSKTVDVSFNLAPGTQFTFGKLSVVGLDLITEPVIRKMWGLAPGKPFNAEYPQHFLDRVKEDGVFENLKNSRAETKVDEANHRVDVTLYFNQKT